MAKTAPSSGWIDKPRCRGFALARQDTESEIVGPPRSSPQTSILLSAEELAELTGYKHATKQLAELHRRGFHRAYIGRHGLVLERAHYEAVCTGATERAKPKIRPLVRPLTSPRKG
jgi:Domain of unknown function (DUF4224)